ncbi:putative ribonuclease H-like domain-containing protein [Tanacetum coccineum]
MSMSVRKTQDHKTVKIPQVDNQRLDLADDLIEAQVHISTTITSHKTKTTTSMYNILHEESKDYKLNTRSRLLSLKKWPNYALMAFSSSSPDSEVSDDEEEDVSQPKIEKKTLRPSIVRNEFTWVFFLATKDETSGILKSFITGIENLVDHKVKVIRCDKGTEFKNREINQFCEIKGILRQFSVAKTPQQNKVAERRNRTLIKAARTMLANSKLPTTFWAEAVNTACYVQNIVLVVKPHNKTPYELFHGRTQTLSFMRPFGCPVTILNTIDHLRFSESTPNVVGSGLDWLFDIDTLTRIMNYEPIITGTQSNGFVGTKASDNEKKIDEDPRKESECSDQEKEDNVNSTNNVNTISLTVNAASINEVNADGGKTSIKLLNDPNMHALEDDNIFGYLSDGKYDDVEADMNNLETIIQVSSIPSTRIHKDHSLDQVIRDLQSAT